ncbi:MAG: HaeIII family restriction endonuclease [Bacteroidota bacterium]
MPTQKDAGKAFEYALITEANNVLSNAYATNLVIDACYENAKESFLLYTADQKRNYTRAAIASINHIISLEPRLVNPTTPDDVIQLQLMPDRAGQQGDVRDILFIRSRQNWEIGISAKNNHKAVKHSRLSDQLDFGNEWMNVNCSQGYFDAIIPIFQNLRNLRARNEVWRNVRSKDRTVYIPILDAFIAELNLINQQNNDIPRTLVSYLLGRHDFYKVIKRKNVVEVLAFNMNGTLNRSINGNLGRTVQKLRLPNQIIQLAYKPNSTNTLLLVCDQGWTISFRIHNAESRVVPSLKFDINLVGHPQTMYSNHIHY